MDISEERWAKMISEVKQVSETRNSQEDSIMEEIAVFKVIKTCDSFGDTKYEWTYFEKDCWVNSSNWFDTKGECLLNFILEEASLQIEGIDD